MKTWNKRSDIEASLFNPAFCGELILHAVESYNKTAKQGGFPYAMAYLILPMLMSAEVSNLLPSSRRTSFISWLFANRYITPVIAQKTKDLKEYTHEAILLDLSLDLLQIDDNSDIVIGTKSLARKRNFHRDEVDQIIKKAAFVGSWLGNAGDVVTIYSIIGITV
jgi:hypothetical protein